MPPVRRARLLLLAALLSISGIVAACASNCLQIQNQLCLCQGQTVTEQDTCQSNASTQESNNPPTAAENQACAKILPGCTDLIDGGSGCFQLETPEGQKICGLQSP